MVYQNEIVSSLNEKGLTHCDLSILYEFRKQLIRNKVQDEYTYIKCKNLAFELSKPKRYKDNNYCLKMIRELDEARQYVTPDTFDTISAVDFVIG